MKKDCEDFAIGLTAYSDGELSGNEIQRVEKHLESCPSCQHQLNMVKETNDMIKNTLSNSGNEVDLDGVWKNIEAQIDFKSSIWQKIKKLFGKPTVWIPTAVATAATALVIFYMPFMHEKPQLEVSRVESVFSKSCQVMIMKTATSGQPLIWILPDVNKEAG